MCEDFSFFRNWRFDGFVNCELYFCSLRFRFAIRQTKRKLTSIQYLSVFFYFFNYMYLCIYESSWKSLLSVYCVSHVITTKEKKKKNLVFLYQFSLCFFACFSAWLWCVWIVSDPIESSNNVWMLNSDISILC